MRFKVRSRTLSWLLTVIMVMSLFINVSPLAAAETFTGTIPPTWQNGTLNAADVTGNSFTLSRTGAQDDAGGTGYKIYKNNSVMTPVDDAYTYGVSGRGLQPATPYPFPVPALAAAGNESSAGPGISLATEGEILPLALVSAATDHLGKTVTLEFNRDMNDPAGKEGQFSVSVDGTAAAISAAALGSDSKQILLYLDKPIGYAATPRIITLGYTAGDVTAADGTALESFSEQSVANNIIKLELVDYEPAVAETAWEDDPAGGKILTYTLKDRMDYDNVNLAIYFSNGFFRNFADNLANYVRFYNKDTGEEVVLPNILTEPVPFTGSLPNRYMEYTDWYFEQISGRAPLGLALKSCALQPDTTYVVEVLKGFSFHNGPINNTYRFEFTTTLDSRYKPSWPQDAGLTTDISDTAVRLQWPEAEDNHGAAYTNGAVYDEDDVNYLYIPNLHYDIYQDNGLIGTADERTTTCDVTNLNPGTTYTFMVKAVDFAGNVSPALETTVTMPVKQPPVLAADTTDNLCGYDVEISFTPDSAWQRAITDITVDGVSIAGKYIVTDGAIIIDGAVFTADRDYTIVVKAAGYSDATVIQSMLLPVYTGPTWPEGSSLTATEITKNEVTLSWSAASDDVAVTGYRVYQDGTPLTATPVTDLVYRVTGLSPGTWYTFTVQAGDADGNWSTDGPSVTVRTKQSGGGGGGASGDTQAPTWPPNAKVTVSRSQTEAVLTWPAATDNKGVTGYRIKRDGVELAILDGNTATYTDTGLERGNNTYVWSVEAVDAAGNWSTAITGRSLSGQNPLSFIAAKSSLTTVNGDNSTDDGPIEGSTTVPVNPTIRLYFDRGVTTDAVWGNNQQCITLQDSTGKNVPVNVFRLGSTDTINDNLHYILIRPKSPLTAGKTYKIIISKNLTANNGRTLGENNGNKDEEVTFTVAAGSGSKGNGGGGGGGGGAVTTEGPTSTKGSASVDPAMGATVSLGDMARVVIPANALKGTGSVTVEIKKVTRPTAIPPGLKLAGEVYEFSVDGRTTYDFAKKVALTLQFNPSRIGANEVPAIYFYDGPSSEWINLGGTVSGSTITVAVDHFTKYAVFAVPKPADPVEAPPPAGTFNDIAGHWAQSKIEELVALGVVNGYPDGSFKPDGTITRAEFTTMLVKAFELSPQTGKVFADTSRHWARDYIATAEAYRLVSGYNAGTFGPDDLITREQTALMIVKAAGLTMISEETSFADNSAISGWAKDAVATAVANGLMKGYPDNIFRPLGSATRAEAVTVILSALNPAKN
jgi:uncharacterized repeat protein (TIGR02059 family)